MMRDGNQEVDSADIVDPQIVIDKIRQFRSLNIRNMSDLELDQAIFDTISINNKARIMVSTRSLSAGTSFFRVRKLTGTTISECGLDMISAYWEPPAEYVTKRERLNKEHESMLYVSISDPQAAINECRVREGELFVLIKYVSIDKVNINVIGGKNDYAQMGVTDKKLITIYDLYNNFLMDEFSREVGVGTEYIYRTSEMIAKSYFDLPPEVQDAWAYVSVQDKEKYNACFRPGKAHALLKLDCALICKLIDGLIGPGVFVRFDLENEEPKFLEITQELMEFNFPELKRKDD